MTVAQKIAAGLILIGVITAATLPGRQTVAVVQAGQKFLSGAEHTAITGNA
jgi:hypothetical protein